MKFKKQIKAIKNHFGIDRKDIDIPTEFDYDDEFMIFGKPIEVVTMKIALKNAQEFRPNEDIFDYVSINKIDHYTRLGNSDYFFRFM